MNPHYLHIQDTMALNAEGADGLPFRFEPMNRNRFRYCRNGREKFLLRNYLFRTPE